MPTPRNEFPKLKQFDTIVIGGGIAGAATCFYLSQSGAHTALLDMFDLNTGASGRNAGSLHGQIQYEPFDQLGADWARTFLPALEFLADSISLWKSLPELLNSDLEISSNGGIMVAEKEEDLRQLQVKVDLENSIGIPSIMLSQSELLEKAPYVSQRMVGAAFCPIEGKANPLLATPAFAKKARELGATIHTGVEVLKIDKVKDSFLLTTTSGDYRCKKIVLTSNAGLSRLVGPLGLDAHVENSPVQVSVTEQIQHYIKYLFYFTTEKLTLKQAKSGSVLIGGGWPATTHSDGSISVNPDSLRSNLRVALKVVPGLSPVKVIRTWVGMGSQTPDQRPVIDSLPGFPGAYVGIYPSLGFSAGPLLGKTLAELTLNGESDRDLSEFRFDRFASPAAALVGSEN